MTSWIKRLSQITYVALSLSGCVSQMAVSPSAVNIADENLALISTPSSKYPSYGPSTIIATLDGEKLIAWRVKVAPGRHKVGLRDVVSGAYISFIVDTQPGKRYDLTFGGKGWETTRNAQDDDKFLGDFSGRPTNNLTANSARIFVTDEYILQMEIDKQKKLQEKEDAKKAWESSPAGQDAIRKAEQKKAAEQAAQREEFARSQFLVKTIGQKICKEIDGTEKAILGSALGQPIYGPSMVRKYYITGFTENVTGEKIQLRIASIRKRDAGRFVNVDHIDGDIVIQPNSVVWDVPLQWYPC